MQSVILSFVAGLTALWCAPSAEASILHVPSEFETIQFALDVCAEFDTILVAPGVYVESLIGPNHSFELWGEQPPDSMGGAPCLLDPSILPGSDSLSSLTTQSGTLVTVRNFKFHNSELMREGRIGGPNLSGGINNSAGILTVKNCIFDSVAAAVLSGLEIRLSNCDFIGCRYPCAFASSPSGRIIADSCSFGGNGWYLVRSYRRSEFRNCNFYSNPIGDHLSLYGDSIIVEDCFFQATLGLMPAIRIHAIDQCIIRNNWFINCIDLMDIINVSMECPQLNMPIIIESNVFENYHMQQFPAAGMTAIEMSCQSGTGFMGLIQNNLFIHGTSSSGSITAGILLSMGAYAAIRSNNFVDLNPAVLPDVYAIGNQDSTQLRNNFFEPEGVAAQTEQGGAMDAILNWWGHATGPYHPTLNPDGQGATVGDNIDFIPWLEDTTEPNDTAELPDLIPKSFSLSAYPNPFNGTARITFSVEQIGDYAVVLYDITGRRVREIFYGEIRDERQIMFDGSDLASGIYFAGLENVDGEQFAVAKLCLLK